MLLIAVQLKHFMELPEGRDSQGLPYPGINTPRGPRAGHHFIDRPEGIGLFEPRSPTIPPRGPRADRIIVNIPNAPRGRGGFVNGIGPGRMGGDSSQSYRGRGGRGSGQGRGRGGQGGHNWGGQVRGPGVAPLRGHGGRGRVSLSSSRLQLRVTNCMLGESTRWMRVC